MAMIIVLVGPPGAGKGTQAQIVSETLCIPHISSGVIFRENLDNQTELGKLARSFLEHGELVPDDLTIAMIRERLSRPDCKDGALLDGFPRTTDQAEALAVIMNELYDRQVDAVPFIHVPVSALIERMTGRLTCKAEGHVFHEKHNPPKLAGVCDYDGSELYQREDDKEETVRHRIHVYFDQTAPLIEYYKDAGKLIEIDGNKSIEEVSADILSALNIGA